MKWNRTHYSGYYGFIKMFVRNALGGVMRLNMLCVWSFQNQRVPAPPDLGAAQNTTKRAAESVHITTRARHLNFGLCYGD